MKTEIQAHLNDPKILETLYRSDRTAFKQSFNTLYPTLSGNVLADYWYERLNYEPESKHRGTQGELPLVILVATLAAFVAQFPSLFAIDGEFFYSRNIGFIVFPFLALYFARKRRLSVSRTAMLLAAMAAGSVFINLLPRAPESDTLVLSCLHLPLVLWSITGLAFTGNSPDKPNPRIAFLTYNGDLLVMMAIIVIAGALLTGTTIGLFSAIGLDIEDFYIQYIGVTGLAITPLIATHLIQTHPQLVGKVSPVIARIFAPLVLAMLMVYLTAIAYGGKDPYTDRDFLIIFNVLLIGVMAIIFFSIASSSTTARHRADLWVLTGLAAVTVIVNGIALSAILFRISEWGVTPNRAAVLGANLLVLVNLLAVLIQLLKVLFKDAPLATVRAAVSRYLPIYSVWALIVTVFFPLIFGF